MFLLRWLGLVRLVAWGACSLALTTAVAARPPDDLGRPPGDLPTVEGIDVERVVELRDGVPLNFSVFGSPRAAVSLQIEGAPRALALREVEPGVYEGTYVVGHSDDIRADSRVVAILKRDGMLVRATLEEPLLLKSSTLPWERAAPPRSSPPVAALAPRPQTVSLVDEVPRPAGTPVPRASCANCGVVESVQKVAAPARIGGLGAVAGAIVGAVVGHEAVDRHQQRMMTLLGAVGGALLGREIALRSTAEPSYMVSVRMVDGQHTSHRFTTEPTFRAGDSVAVSASGELVATPATTR